MSSRPKISIVTPNYNYGHFLEETIQSVLDQEYPNLEYIIIDGGSTDESIKIIKRYEKYLTYWVSEKDNGVYDALNKGFVRCSGDIMAYLNSDDVYLPWSFQTVAEIFQVVPSVSWISTLQPGYLDHESKSRWFGTLPGFSKQYFLEGGYAGRFSKYQFIQQESTFWRKELWIKSGMQINTKYKLAGDFYLWNEFYKHTDLFGVNTPLSLFRLNERQKSNDVDSYISECLAILEFSKTIHFKDILNQKTLLRCLKNRIQIFNDKLFNQAEFYEGKIVQLNDINNKNSSWQAKPEVFHS